MTNEDPIRLAGEQMDQEPPGNAASALLDEAREVLARMAGEIPHASASRSARRNIAKRGPSSRSTQPGIQK